MTIDDVFGLLKQKLPGYEPRRQQVSMSKAIGRILKSGERIIVEAGTGTGKTISYLVPAILQVLSNIDEDEPDGACVVVATANIALQEQLIKKDLPFLAELFPPFTYVLAKGRSNYLCLTCLKTNQQTDFDFVAHTPEEAALIEWANKTETGDKSELSFEPSYEEWSRFSTTSEECLGNKCPHQGDCFAKKARSALQEAQVIVCNYHLLMTHLMLLEETGKADLIFPAFKYLVCDEGHKIADIARAFLGWTLGEGATSRAIDTLDKSANKHLNSLLTNEEARTYKGVANRAADILAAFWKKIKDYHGGDKKGKEDGRNQGKRITKKGWFGDVDGAIAALDEVAIELTELSSRLARAAKTEPDKVEAFRYGVVAKRCREISGQILEANALEIDEAVYFTNLSPKSQKPQINRRMIDVSGELWDSLWKPASVVVTSATLAVNESYEYIRGEIGLKIAEEFICGSPFDYQKQSLLVVSDKAPDPTQKDYSEKVCKILEYVIREAQGRTLCLFTSYKNLNLARDYLRKAGLPYNILCHGDAPRMQLVKTFKEDIDSVLLGTESFWAGIDVPGEACSCVVIDKLPFKSPGDPVWDALVDRAGSSWFYDLAIPSATIQLKQGVGRLIRCSSDKGVVVILDNRLATKGYGSTILDSLPPMRRGRTLKQIGPFLSKVAKGG